MERALLLVGRLNNADESYQLLCGCDYLSYTYDGSVKRKVFLSEVKVDFANEILSSKNAQELGISNGLRINPELGKAENINLLEQFLVDEFTNAISSEVIKRASEIANISMVN